MVYRKACKYAGVNNPEGAKPVKEGTIEEGTARILPLSVIDIVCVYFIFLELPLCRDTLFSPLSSCPKSSSSIVCTKSSSPPSSPHSYLRVRVKRMVLKDSIEEMFPKWPGEPDDPQLVRLITDIHAGRFVKGFWEVHGNTQGNAHG
ncbi:BnaCnng63990D [Brassica napus]|uniref:Uncharacterized protein n=2 Tax=Brassica TaxID=3705 RepID=A0A0D3C406_BRAOL|nr:unnamed protein product [Brassica napus]CDY69525.1 BnaCnng63990D [Brassica napus]